MPYLRNGPSIYQTADGRLVLEGDPDAAILVVADGCQISDEVARTYGLVKADGRHAALPKAQELDETEDEDDEEASAALAKQQKQEHANKQRQATAPNKSTS